MNGAMSGIEIRLVEDSQVLDDVVVVGYGTQKKSVVTAAISKIDEDKLACLQVDSRGSPGTELEFAL